VLNLVINARDAVLEKGGGSVAIAAGEARLAAGDPALPPELAPGLFAMLTIADDGAGMAPEVRAKVFEPFFTTKETGKGSGLGLSQVYGFVRQSGGHVTIASEPGRGTVVTLYLPESGAAAAAAPVDAPAAGEAAALRRGAVVLVAEDEDDVREFAAAVLSGRGVEVLEASTGEGALELLARRPDVDLVFSDVVMPGRSGVELAAHVLAELPGIAVVLTSGYTKELAEGADLPGSVRFLPKPYRAGELCAAIDAALAERHAAA